MAKKKTVDEKITDLEERLKKAKIEKKEYIQRKGRIIWQKIKPLIVSNEKVLYDLLTNEENLNELYETIEKKLEKLYSKEKNITEDTCKKEKENE